jgi:hypothetical protein
MSINHQWLLGALSHMLWKINDKKSNQIMHSQEARNRKEKQGEEERRTSKLEPKIQVLVHLFLVLLLLLLLVVFSTHVSNWAWHLVGCSLCTSLNCVKYAPVLWDLGCFSSKAWNYLRSLSHDSVSSSPPLSCLRKVLFLAQWYHPIRISDICGV